MYPDFHSIKRALWLVDSWPRASDQIQMYSYQDTIVQFLPARRTQQHVISAWLAWSSARAHFSLIDEGGPENTVCF